MTLEKQFYLTSNILMYENNQQYKQTLKQLCQEFNLNGVFVSNPQKLISAIDNKMNIGAILLSNADIDLVTMLAEIIKRLPGVPLFIQFEDDAVKKLNKEYFNEIIRSYDPNDLETIKALFSRHLFNRIYPPELVEKLNQIAVDAIKSKFINVTIDNTEGFLASDKRIYGGRTELMSVRSSWCEGVVMLQTQGHEIEGMIKAGRSTFPGDDGYASLYAEDLLRELMNMIWGGFKSKFVPNNIETTVNKMDVPITINHDDRYISFGVIDPLLCFKYEISDSVGNEFKALPLYLKFSFHIYWDLSSYQENESVDELVETDDLEFF